MRRLKLTLSGRHIRHNEAIVALVMVAIAGILFVLFNVARQRGKWGQAAAYLLACLFVVVVALVATWWVSG